MKVRSSVEAPIDRAESNRSRSGFESIEEACGGAKDPGRIGRWNQCQPQPMGKEVTKVKLYLKRKDRDGL